MPDVATEHAHWYWKYEYDVMSRYLLPLLDGWGVRLRGSSVLDVGCGEGGGLCAVFDGGARCDGFDVDGARIALAQSLAGERSIRFGTGDIYSSPPPYGGELYDLVMLHDVFEHLEQKHLVLRMLSAYLRPSGKIFITFPPYYSAFGAHQQHLRSLWARLPFAHLLPGAMPDHFARLRNEHEVFLSEVLKLGRSKMGMRSFEQTVHGCDMMILRKKAYLISPNYIRFGLRPVAAGPLSRLPLVGELLSSAVAYLVAPPGGKTAA